MFMRATVNLGDVINGWRVLAVTTVPPHWKRGARSVAYEVECTNCQLRRAKTYSNLKADGMCHNCYLLPKGQSGLKRLMAYYQRNARKAGRVFSLNLDAFAQLTSSPCFYCGSPPSKIATCNKYHRSKKSTWGDYVFNGIDRIDNDAGYTPENCLACCAYCNRARNSDSFEEYAAHWQAIRERFAVGHLPALFA